MSYAHAVVEQTHNVCGTEVHASLFYSSLQKALTGEKPTLTDKISTKVNVPVSEELLRFFETNERCRKQLENEAKLLHAKVLIDSSAAANELILEMDVNKESLAALQIAPTWESKTMREAESFLSRYDTAELPAEKDVWTRAENDCNCLITLDTALSYRELHSKAVIAGVKEEVKVLSDKITTLLKNTAAEVEVERNTAEVDIQLDCRETFDLIKERVESRLGQVSLSHDEKQHIISLRGLKDQVHSVEMLIKQAQKNIVKHQLKLSSHLSHFLKSLDLEKFEQDYFLPSHIPARLLKRQDFFGILVEKENLKRAEDKIREILKEQVIQLSPNQTGDTWTHFLRNLQDDIESFQKAHDIRIAQSNNEVIICGFSSAVADVTGKVKRYLDNKEPTTENVPLKSVREAEFVESCLNLSELPELKSLGSTVLAYRTSNCPCLKITAAKDNIKDAVRVVQQQSSSILMESHKYSKAGEAKFLEKHEANVKTKAEEMQCSLYLSQEHVVKSSPPKSFTHKIGNFMTLSIAEGDLHHFTADALTCPMNANLAFSNPVAQCFLQFGGDEISEVCKTQQKQQQSLLPGDVVLSDAGKLNTGTLIYAVLPQKGQRLDSHYLQSAVYNSLLKAEGKGCASMALPAVGCESFGFSVKDSCVALRAAVLQFCSDRQNSPKNIRCISIVDSDEEIVEEYNTLIQELGFPDTSTTVPLQSLKLKHGSDTREVCKTQQKQQQSLLPGDVVLSDAGKLNTGTLIYAVLPQKEQRLDSHYLQSAVYNSLLKAEGKGCASIALPAVGCESFGFSVKDSCVALRAAVLQFCSDRQNSPKNIRRISIVESDEKIVEEYNALIQELGFPDTSTTVPLQSLKLKHGSDTRVLINGVPICLKEGDITKETVDVIVNSTNKSLDLNTVIILLSAGRGGFAPKESIKAIFTALEKHLKEPNSSCLRSITIVAFEQKTFDDFRDHFKAWNKPASGKMPENQVKIGSIRIEVKKGDITNETVRGIVNTTNMDMSLRGGVSGAIFKAAGASVEQECQKHGPLQNDIAAVTSGRNLHCDFIIHMVGPHSAAEVRSRVKNVLELCEEKQITTVSFPAVGTGMDCEDAIGAMLQGFEDHLAQNISTVIKLIYIVIDRDNVLGCVSLRLTAFVKGEDAIGAMLQGFEDHLAQNISTVIKLIYFVIDRDNVLQEFQKGLKTWIANTQDSEDDEWEDYSSTEESSSSDKGANANPVEVMMGPVKVRVFSGDITKETVEAIVNSTTTSLDFNTGVSGAILKASGQTVVNEWKSKECPSGAGNLAAAGVANAMTEALTNFMKDSPKHLKRVHLVIFQAKLLPDFQEAIKKCKKIFQNASVRQVKPLQQSVIPVLTQRPAICLAKETAAVSFPVMAINIYRTSPTNLTKVKNLLDELGKQECFSIDVQFSHITDLPETDKKAIMTLSRANQISVLVASSGKLTVSGKRDDVLDAVLKINSFIQAVREREMREGEVKCLRETLCWEVARGDRWESLEPGISYDIELTIYRKEKSFQYQENGETYTVDFNQMEVTNSKRESCRIKRTLLGDSDTAIIHPPPTWTKMDGRDLEIITLQSDTVEYKNIETAFLKSSIHRDVKPVQVQQLKAMTALRLELMDISRDWVSSL
ncbi:poly [ADP-ribose] polymerase 14-like [Sinocyclocheilus grahami]|uniref:poly [ADP-ribose] polymerase 14-like n=1 Tax=Sinocyclocheilus grahami TaxID=75366 RepID=UPI0007ACBD96|nr:PREDICTED: poly [ADP-ribose] polymerase 14-like [Sinocyclocheilus grahami]